MRIGVLSDTHLRNPEPFLDRILDEVFADVEMILHAGDIVTRKVLERLEERGVLAVCGNMDDYEVADTIPQSRIIPVDKWRIGLIHGWGSKEGLPERVISRFGEDEVGVIVFGHSHIPFWENVKGIYMFNPGSASQNRYIGNGTVGVLRIEDEGIDAQFINVSR